MTVLKALEYQATRYQAKGRLTEDKARSHCWSLDETGTINTAGLGSREEIQQQEQIDIRGVSDEVLTVHGTLPGCKKEGITLLLYENPNGIHNRLGGNEKLEKAKDLIDELGADVVAYNGHRQNLRHRDNRNGWNQLFWGGEAEARLAVAHNVHKADRIGRCQEGGTALLMFGPLTEYLDTPSCKNDVSGLGRWTSMVLKGSAGVQTRIICGYNPCRSNRQDNLSIPSSTRHGYDRREEWLVS